METGFLEISDSEYRAMDGVNQSSLKSILKSPAHYRAALTQTFEPTPSMALGSALHCLVLEPSEFEKRYVVAPDDVGTRASKAYKDFEKESKGRVILKLEEMDHVRGMLRSVMSHPAAKRMFELDGRAEQACAWIDPATSLLCKSKLDWLTADGVLVDLKTTKDAGEWSFSKSILDYMYHFQAAFYIDGVAKISKQHASALSYKIIAVESMAPYGVRVYSLSDEALDIGRAKVRLALDTLSTCRTADIWPCYATEVAAITLPRYALQGIF